MEYPTLFTGGASVFAPPELQSPEGVTIHEAGHQFWYGLVANNEFEEAWLDEGFNTYMTSKATDHSLGPEGWGRHYFGGGRGGGHGGWPVVAPGVAISRGSESLVGLREGGEEDVMAKKAWTYRDGWSYRLNSYDKPALVLQTLEGLLGEETMVKVLRTYARRYRFAHPTTGDFIATVDEVTGQDWRWFFDQTFFSADLCDYAVEVRSEPVRTPAGWLEGKDGKLELKAPGERDRRGDDEGPFESRVTVVRQRRGAPAGGAAGRLRRRADGHRAMERPRPLGALPVRGDEGRPRDGGPRPQDRDRRRPLEQRVDRGREARPPGRHEVGGAVPLLAPEPAGAAHRGGVRPC